MSAAEAVQIMLYRRIVFFVSCLDSTFCHHGVGITDTKFSHDQKDQKWMIIYNQLQGKVNGNIYAYSLKRCDNMKFAKITPSKQISEKDKLYQTIIKDHKHTQKESDSIPGKIGDTWISREICRRAGFIPIA